MCSHCSGGEYRESIAADARARQRAESAGRYDGHRSVAPHLKRTMELRQELQQEPVTQICSECQHPVALHGTYGCEVEGGDEWVEGQNSGALMAQGPCGCTSWKASAV